MTYSDPEGEWEITEIDGTEVTIKCIQEGNLNEGREFGVSLEEAEHYINHRYPDW